MNITEEMNNWEKMHEFLKEDTRFKEPAEGIMLQIEKSKISHYSTLDVSKILEFINECTDEGKPETK
jgi:hypothetical protein